MADPKHPTCTICGREGIHSHTKYGDRYDCPNQSHDPTWAWGNFPMVSKVIQDGRKAAHYHFDQLWKSPCSLMSRSNAYKALSQYLGIRRDDCHMKLMTDPEMLLKVIEFVDNKMKCDVCGTRIASAVDGRNGTCNSCLTGSYMK